MSTDNQGQDASASTAPPLRVINRDATPEEIAVIVAVLAAVGGGDAPEPEIRASRWAAPGRRVRLPFSHGPGAWRASVM